MVPSPSCEYIEKQAVIFGRNPDKCSRLTPYHLKINDAAKALCLKNPELLNDRAKLLELSREKVHADGYQYHKGVSRSKRYHSDVCQKAPKRGKVSEDVQLRRIGELQEDIQDVGDQIKIKAKRRDLAAASHQYKDCDRLTSQISVLRQKLREHQTELNRLEKKQRKSVWYQNRKSRSDVSPSPSPVPGSSSMPCGSNSEVLASKALFHSPPPLMSPNECSRHVSLSSSSPVTSPSPIPSPVQSSPVTDSEHDTMILSSEEDSDNHMLELHTRKQYGRKSPPSGVDDHSSQLCRSNSRDEEVHFQ